MKNILSLVVICFLVLPNLMAQGITPPLAVKATFNNQHPEVERPFWEIREGAMVALFKEEDRLVKAFFERNGEWRETRSRTPLTLLPEAVQYFITSNFKDADITYVGVVTAPQKRPLYRVESEIQDAVVIKLLNKDGVLVRQERIDFDTSQQIPVTGKD